MEYYKETRHDLLTSELCQEIDLLRSEVKYWRTQFEEERAANNIHLNESLETAKKGVANALMFALSVTDNPDGSLSISKQDRKQLANSFKK